MDKDYAKSLVTVGKNQVRLKHGAVWFSNLITGLEDQYRSIQLIKKYVAKTGHKIVVQLHHVEDQKTNSAFHIFGSYTDLEQFEMKTRKVDHLYEIVLTEKPRFFYVDLEWLLGMDTSESVIAANVRVVVDYVQHEYNIELD